jgi:hypothetical protein
MVQGVTWAQTKPLHFPHFLIGVPLSKMAASSESSTSHPGVLTCLMLSSLISSTEVPRSLVSWSTSQWTARLLLAFNCRNLMLKLYEVSCSRSLPQSPSCIRDKLPGLLGARRPYRRNTKDYLHSFLPDGPPFRSGNRFRRPVFALLRICLRCVKTASTGNTSPVPRFPARDIGSIQCGPFLFLRVCLHPCPRGAGSPLVASSGR